MDHWGRVFGGARLFSRGVARQRGRPWASGRGFWTISWCVGMSRCPLVSDQGIHLKRVFSRGVVSFTQQRSRCGVRYGFSRWLMWLDGFLNGNRVGHGKRMEKPIGRFFLRGCFFERLSDCLMSFHVIFNCQGSEVLPNFGRELWEISHLFVWPSEVTAAKKELFQVPGRGV